MTVLWDFSPTCITRWRHPQYPRITVYSTAFRGIWENDVCWAVFMCIIFRSLWGFCFVVPYLKFYLPQIKLCKDSSILLGRVFRFCILGIMASLNHIWPGHGGLHSFCSFQSCQSFLISNNKPLSPSINMLLNSSRCVFILNHTMYFYICY